MTKKPAKPPAERTIKSFFKSLETGRVDDVKKQLAKLDPNLRYNTGYGEKPALVAAAGARQPELACVTLLLDAGADLTATDSRGRTALHAACDEGNLAIVELLIARGASIQAKDAAGLTPYAYATQVEIRKALRAHGDPGFGPRGGRVLAPRVQANAKNMEIARGALGVDRDGRVWFAGYSGIFCHDGKTMTRYVFEESFATCAVAAGPPGVVYFATNWGLLEFRAGVFTLFGSRDSEVFDQHVTGAWGAPDGRVYLLHYESERTHKHVTVFDGTTFTVLTPGEDFPGEIEIECLAFDHAGELVLGGDEVLARRRAGAWHVERTFGDVVWSPRVYDAIVGPDTSWIATSHGLVVERGGAFSVVELPSAPRTLCKDGGTIWIGYRGGIARLDGETLTPIAKEDSELPDDQVERLVRAPDGRIWIHAEAHAYTLEGNQVRRFD